MKTRNKLHGQAADENIYKSSGGDQNDIHGLVDMLPHAYTYANWEHEQHFPQVWTSSSDCLRINAVNYRELEAITKLMRDYQFSTADDLPSFLRIYLDRAKDQLFVKTLFNVFDETWFNEPLYEHVADEPTAHLPAARFFRASLSQAANTCKENGFDSCLVFTLNACCGMQAF